MLNLRKWIFFFLLSGGVLLSVSSSSWFVAWCGLELNLLSFIPFVSVRGDMYTSESSLKYFLIQALGSAMIVFSCLFVTLTLWMQLVVVSALLLKMGAAPMHFWFPSVMSGLSWSSCLVLMSVQKIAPLGLLSCVLGELSLNSVVMVSVVLGVFVGSVGGLNQVYLRKILAYSSINHVSWILVAMSVGDRSWVMYFVFYVFLSGSVLYLFYVQQIYHISQMVSSNLFFLNVVTYLSLLSLGGLPPFTGFIPKWFVILELVKSSMYFVLAILLTGTLVSLYYYMRLIFLNLSLSTLMMKWSKESFFTSNRMSFLMCVMFLGMLLPSLFMIM